jgi:phage gp36-like protein
MYCTQSQLETRYGIDMLVSLTDRDGPATGLVVAATVEAAIADACEEIDGFVVKRYKLPIDPTPGVLRDLSQVIAIYKLHRREVDAKIQTDYDNAMKRLKDIATGVFVLNAAGIELPGSTSSAGAVETTGPERVLSGGPMEGFI